MKPGNIFAFLLNREVQGADGEREKCWTKQHLTSKNCMQPAPRLAALPCLSTRKVLWLLLRGWALPSGCCLWGWRCGSRGCVTEWDCALSVSGFYELQKKSNVSSRWHLDEKFVRLRKDPAFVPILLFTGLRSLCWEQKPIYLCLVGSFTACGFMGRGSISRWNRFFTNKNNLSLDFIFLVTFQNASLSTSHCHFYLFWIECTYLLSVFITVMLGLSL